MKRLVALGLVLGAFLPSWVVALQAGRADATTVGVQADVRSGGIGLTRADWEDLHGPGDPGQSLVTYEGGAYAVGFEDDTVVFVELGWEDVGNLPFGEAQAEVEDLLPSDADLVEVFALPATAAGPVSLVAHRYQSDALGRALGGPRSDGILVLYQEASDPARFEPDASRASIAVGIAP